MDAGFNSSIEMTTENAHISDSLSITTKSTTFHPTVSYSMKDIEAISDKNKQYGGMFAMIFDS